jgi:hypothetical protein
MNNRPPPIYAAQPTKDDAGDFLNNTEHFLLPGRTNFVGLPIRRWLCVIGIATSGPSTAIACELLRPAPGEMCSMPGAAASGKGSVFGGDDAERGEDCSASLQ